MQASSAHLGSSGNSSLSSTVPSRPAETCGRCLSCCATNLTFARAALIRSAGSSSQWKEWWPASLGSPTHYFFLRSKQLSYLQQHGECEELWRSPATCAYAASALLGRRGRAPLAICVPLTVTGVEADERCAVHYMGTKLVPRPARPPCHDSIPAAVERVEPAIPAPLRLPCAPHARQAPPPSQHAQQHAQQQQQQYSQQQAQHQQHHKQLIALPGTVGMVHAPVAAALAAAKRLAAAAAAAVSTAAAPPPPPLLHGSMHRVPRCLDVAQLSPAASSELLSVASSSSSFGGTLRQLTAHGMHAGSPVSLIDYPSSQEGSLGHTILPYPHGCGGAACRLSTCVCVAARKEHQLPHKGWGQLQPVRWGGPGLYQYAVQQHHLSVN